MTCVAKKERFYSAEISSMTKTVLSSIDLLPGSSTLHLTRNSQFDRWEGDERGIVPTASTVYTAPGTMQGKEQPQEEHVRVEPRCWSHDSVSPLCLPLPYLRPLLLGRCLLPLPTAGCCVDIMRVAGLKILTHKWALFHPESLVA